MTAAAFPTTTGGTSYLPSNHRVKRAHTPPLSVWLVSIPRYTANRAQKRPCWRFCAAVITAYIFSRRVYAVNVRRRGVPRRLHRKPQPREVNTMSKPLKAFGYYGGKFSKLKFILPQLKTEHRTYVELCGGSAAVLLNKPRADVEVLNDASDNIITFWRVLRDRKDELIQAIANTPAGEAEFKYIINSKPSNDELETARRFFIHIIQVFGGMPSHRHHSFLRGALRYTKAQKNLTDVANRMRGVVIENTDACRLITRTINSHRKRKDAQPVLFYADPPYTADSRKSVGEYIHDDFDHDAFLTAVVNAPDFCKFAISGYDNDRYNTAFVGWHRVDLETRLTATRNNGQARTEVLWRNYSLLEDVHLF